MKLTVDETGSEAEKATTALGIDHAMQSVMLTAASLLIVVEGRTASNHMVIACSHATISSDVADMQAPNGQAMQS